MNTLTCLNTRLAALAVALAAAALSGCDRRETNTPVTPSTRPADSTSTPTTPPATAPMPTPPASAASQ